MKEPKKATASVTYEIIVNCPYCDKYIDLMDSPYNDGDGGIAGVMNFKEKGNYFRGEGLNYDVECERCNKTFIVDEVTY